jgi:hypothetical protein
MSTINTQADYDALAPNQGETAPTSGAPSVSEETYAPVVPVTTVPPQESQGQDAQGFYGTKGDIEDESPEND